MFSDPWESFEKKNLLNISPFLKNCHLEIISEYEEKTLWVGLLDSFVEDLMK